jgi:ketosteroid isomerase-like protein
MKTKTYLFILSILPLSVLLTGCNNSQTQNAANADADTATFDLVSMRRTIDEENAKFANAFVNGDSATLVNHYTLDASLFPPNSEAVRGRDAIALLIQQYLKFGIKEFRDEITNLYGSEDNLIEEGNYFMGDGKGNTIDKGKYMDVWRKVNGEWKIYSNIWNSSVPVAAAK